MANVLYVGTANAASFRRFVFQPPATFNYGINVFGANNVFGQTNLHGQLSLKGNALDFGRGGSQITDNGDLNIGTDNNLYLNAPSQVSVQNDLRVGGRLSLLHNGRDNGSGIVDNGDLLITSNDPIQLKTPKWVDVWSTLKLHANLEVTGGLAFPTGSVDGTDIADGAVATADLADGAVTNAKLGADAVTTDKISDGTIVNADVSATAAIAYSKLNIADSDLTIAKTSGLQTALDARLLLAGGTMLGGINMGGNNITNATAITANTFTGNLTGDVTGNVSGNAGTVTNGVYTTGSYNDPAWITGLSAAKLNSGTSANLGAGTVTAATFIGNLTGNVTGDVTGNISGNAGTVTNGVYTTGSYADPSWITSINGSKVIDGTVATAKLADGAVANAKIGTDAVTTDKINDGTIVNADVNAAAAIAYSKLNIADSDLTIAKTNGLQTALDSKLNLSGGTMSGSIDLGSNNITNGGTITATSFVGPLTGNASTATALQTARTINGVSFDGTADITVTAAAGTLTGTTLAVGVTSSSLTSVGTLTDLTVTNPITGSITGSSGSTTGNAATATALQTARTINGVSFDGTANITLTTADIADSTDKRYVTDANLVLLSNTSGVNTGDQDLTGLLVKASNLSDLTSASTARTNLGLGTLATQDGTFSGTSSGTNTGDQTNITGNAGTVTNGVYDNGSYNDPAWITGLSAAKLSSGTSADLGAGNLTATSIFGNLTGNITGNAATATALQTARTINGVSFDGTANITLTTADIADSTDKRYVTDAQLTILNNTSNTNTGDQTNITGNAGTVTNGVYDNGSYNDPAWITGLSGAKINTGTSINLGAGTVTATTFTGSFTGSLTGNVTGDVTGNVSGNQSGGSVSATSVSASGAVDFSTSTSVQVPIIGVVQPCAAADTGKILFYTPDSHFYGCNGTVWKQLDN